MVFVSANLFLSPPVTVSIHRLSTRNNKSLQGIAVFHDKERGTFVNVTKVDGHDNHNFEKKYAQQEKKFTMPLRILSSLVATRFNVSIMARRDRSREAFPT